MTLQTHLSAAGSTSQQPAGARTHTLTAQDKKRQRQSWMLGKHQLSFNTRRLLPHAVRSQVINFTFERFPPLLPRGAPLITTHRQAHTHTYTHTEWGRPTPESVWESARRRLLLVLYTRQLSETWRWIQRHRNANGASEYLPSRSHGNGREAYYLFKLLFCLFVALTKRFSLFRLQLWRSDG